MSTQKIAYEDAPINRFHVRVGIAGSGGQFSDGFVLGIVGIVLASAGSALDLTPLWIGLLGAATLSGLFLGAIVTGPIADRIGRSPIFRWDMLVIAMLSLSQFFVQEAWQLLILRLIFGVPDMCSSPEFLSESSVPQVRSAVEASGFMIAVWKGWPGMRAR